MPSRTDTSVDPYLAFILRVLEGMAAIDGIPLPFAQRVAMHNFATQWLILAAERGPTR